MITTKPAKYQSQSQLLRSVIFRQWEENDVKNFMPFEEFYQSEMDIIISNQKQKTF